MFGKREPPVLPDFSGGLQSRGTLAHESEEGELQRPRLPHVVGPGADRPPPGLTVPPPHRPCACPVPGWLSALHPLRWLFLCRSQVGTVILSFLFVSLESENLTFEIKGKIKLCFKKPHTTEIGESLGIC